MPGQAAVSTANAAVRQSEHMLANWKLASQLGVACDSLRLVRPGSFVNVDQFNPDKRKIHLIVDNARYYKSRGLQTYLRKRKCHIKDPLVTTILTELELHRKAMALSEEVHHWSQAKTDVPGV
jgi:hypothetical protein